MNKRPTLRMNRRHRQRLVDDYMYHHPRSCLFRRHAELQSVMLTLRSGGKLLSESSRRWFKLHVGILRTEMYMMREKFVPAWSSDHG